MKKEIWKYKLKDEQLTQIQMPKNAKILDVQTQNNEACIWVEFDIKNKDSLETRIFVTNGTGIPFNDEHLNYIGTYQRGIYVFHVYEVI